MSNVAINNRSILNQRVANIENNKVALPFNVTKEQIKKLGDLLQKIKVNFLVELDKLTMNGLSYNDMKIKSNDRVLTNNRFTLGKTYVVTMKQNFISKVRPFYEKIVEIKEPERPIFSIDKEKNLQQALEEATVEIDLSAINASLSQTPVMNNTVVETPQQIEPQPAQVLANSPLGETVIENPINLNPVGPQITENQGVQTPINNLTSSIVETTPNNVVNNVQPLNNPETPQQPTTVLTNNVQSIEPANIVQPTVQAVPEEQPATLEQPQAKVRVKKSKGNIFAIPIVVIWLGLVFVGTLKLVTSILS